MTPKRKPRKPVSVRAWCVVAMQSNKLCRGWPNQQDYAVHSTELRAEKNCPIYARVRRCRVVIE